MKKIIAIILICSTVNFGAKAQYVNIPDTSFGKLLIYQYPSCLYKDVSNLYWMDTACVANDTGWLDCSYRNIVTVEGIQYFKKLKTFICNNNQITNIPALSNNLRYLNCSSNQISLLPSLPNSLIFLTCDSNKISAIPSLPIDIERLSCGNNSLTGLPTLPQTLYFLSCENTGLTNLPLLPSGLLVLVCNKNSLTGLPQLPNSLQVLECSNNSLTGLPLLPASLQALGCNNNNLTSLPILLDSIITISCRHNNIFCLPKLPKSLRYIYIDHHKINCLPNAVTNIIVYDSAATNNIIHPPICDPTNNPNKCIIYPTISGKIFTDNNSNTTKDVLEFYSPFIKLSLSNGQTTYSNLQGAYNISIDTLGSYTLKVTPPPYFKAVPDSVNINFTASSTSIVLPDFLLQPIASVDSFAIHITKVNRPRPGFKYAYNISYSNAGTVSSVTDNIISINYDTSKLHFDSASVAVTINSTNHTPIEVNAGKLVAGQSGGFDIYFTVKANVAIGDFIKTQADIIHSSIKSYDMDSTIVVGSFDPNDKQATPTLTQQQVINGEYIDYVVRFQNTGNANATNIIIADSLSSLLQYNNIQVISSSHNSNISYRIGNGIIYFEFFNINLPYATDNEPLSHGFVRFRLKALPTLVAGVIIPNTASIYFDYNIPIITNTAITQITAIVVPVKIIDYDLRIISSSSINQPQTTNINHVLNTWTVGTEINVSHYVVQRSDNNRDFINTGEVVAQGFTSYNYTDKLPLNLQQTIIYYRLKIVDKDGKISYSQTKTLNLKNRILNSINIYPNPAKDIVNIDVDEGKQLLIIDAIGRTTHQLNSVTKHQTINVKQFAKGVYLVKVIMNSGEVKTSKLIVE